MNHSNTHAGLFLVFGALSVNVQQTPRCLMVVNDMFSCRGIGRASIHYDANTSWNDAFHVWIVRVYLALVSSIFSADFTTRRQSTTVSSCWWTLIWTGMHVMCSRLIFDEIRTKPGICSGWPPENIRKPNFPSNNLLNQPLPQETCDIAAKLFFTTEKWSTTYFQFCDNHSHRPPFPVCGNPIPPLFSWAFVHLTQLLQTKYGQRSFSTFLVVFACFCFLPPRPDHDHENDRDCNDDCNNFAGIGFEIEIFYFLDLFGIAESNTCRSFCSLRCTISGLPANTMSSDCCGWPPERPNSPSNGPPSWN